MSATEGEIPDDDLIAAEYALGSLDESERAAFEARLRREPALAAAVARWRERLVALDETTGETAPPARVWAGIEARLPAPEAARPPAPPPSAAPEAAAPPRAAGAEEVAALRASLRRWRVAAGVGAALAAGFAAFALVPAGLVGPASPPAAGARFVAVVDADGALPALVVQVDVDAGIVRVLAPAAEAPPRTSLELWLVAEGAAPRSLGLVADAAVLRAPDLSGAAPGATLAVSVEPPGGSPTGAPTGPVVYTGRLLPEPPGGFP